MPAAKGYASRSSGSGASVAGARIVTLGHKRVDTKSVVHRAWRGVLLGLSGREDDARVRSWWRDPMAGIGIIRCGRASPGTGSGRWRPAGPAAPRRAHRPPEEFQLRFDDPAAGLHEVGIECGVLPGSGGQVPAVDEHVDEPVRGIDRPWDWPVRDGARCIEGARPEEGRCAISRSTGRSR
jgi:hypothetical protein